MAPLSFRNIPTVLPRALGTASGPSNTLAKRYYYYYSYTPSGAAIAGIIISIIFLLLAFLSCFMRMKYGWSWYGRPYNNRTTTYTGPYSQAAGYTGGYNSQQNRQWPGQTSNFAAPNQVGENATDLNAYGQKRGPGTYEPPPMYSGPGSFYQSGRHGQGTSYEQQQQPPVQGSRLEDHAGLRNVPA